MEIYFGPKQCQVYLSSQARSDIAYFKDNCEYEAVVFLFGKTSDSYIYITDVCVPEQDASKYKQPAIKDASSFIKNHLSKNKDLVFLGLIYLDQLSYSTSAISSIKDVQEKTRDVMMSLCAKGDSANMDMELQNDFYLLIYHRKTSGFNTVVNLYNLPAYTLFTDVALNYPSVSVSESFKEAFKKIFKPTTFATTTTYSMATNVNNVVDKKCDLVSKKPDFKTLV